MTRLRIGKWGFAARPCKNGALGFVAWCKRGDTEAEGPMEEHGQVWFQFDASADAAIARLAREVGAAS